MQDFSILDDDFSEIEETLGAVEESLKANNNLPKIKLNKVKQSVINKAKNYKVLSFRGINSAKQKNQKSVILRRDLTSKKRRPNLETNSLNSLNPPISNVIKKPQLIVLPNLKVIKAKLKLKSVTNSLNRSAHLNKKSLKLNNTIATSTKIGIKQPEKLAKKLELNNKNSNLNDPITLKVRNSNYQKSSKLIANNDDRIRLQKLKIKIKNNATLSTNNSIQYTNKNLAKEHLLNLVTEKQQQKKLPINKIISSRSNDSNISASRTKRIIPNLRTQQNKPQIMVEANKSNVKLKEALIQKALSEVPMALYHDHDANKQNLKRSYKMKTLRKLSLAGFVLVFGGYLFFLNIPNISFRVAAIQSGMSQTATLPNYKPAGYSLKSRATYGPGYVKIELKNNGGNKLELTQEKSSFDSEALKDNIVARADGGYSTYVKDGLTIYLYNKGGAAWVNKGQVYSLQGNTSDLSSDEILNMAVSM